MTILRGDAAGGFGSPVSFPTAQPSEGRSRGASVFTIADFDGDGFDDILAANDAERLALVVLLGAAGHCLIP